MYPCGLAILKVECQQIQFAVGCENAKWLQGWAGQYVSISLPLVSLTDWLDTLAFLRLPRQETLRGCHRYNNHRFWKPLYMFRAACG